MKYFQTKIALAIYLTCMVPPVHAVWYQVEMIVFENLYPDTDGEYWYTPEGLVPLENSLSLKSYSKRPPSENETTDAVTGDVDEREEMNAGLFAYEKLPDDNRRLSGIYRVLRLSREYRPVYHVTWQQPGLEADQAQPVHLQTNESPNLFPLTIPVHLVTDPMPANFYEPIELVLDGLLRIRSSLYLHVDLDMVLFRSPPAAQIDPIEPPNENGDADPQSMKEPVGYVRLTESRRIRLNELHYFDHPLFGVILQVSRYGEDQSTDPEEFRQ